MIGNPSLHQPKHDPIADTLGEDRVDKKISPEDRERFMKTVQKAMSILNRHPDTEVTKDERGKPVEKKLMDDVELPGGSERILIKFQATKGRVFTLASDWEVVTPAGQPYMVVIVVDLFRSEKWSNRQGGHGYAYTCLDQYADGHIGLEHGSVKNPDEIEGVLSGEIDEGYGYLSQVDHMTPFEGGDVWGETGEIEQVIDALAAQV